MRSFLPKSESTAHVVTIGNFDGVHRGHQYLIEQVILDANAREARSLVITFEPHPTTVLRPDAPFERLTSPETKLTLLSATGADEVVVVPFTREFAGLSAEEFLDEVLAVRPVSLHVGEGFRFGRMRSGDGETIRKFGEQHGFETHVITRLRDGDDMISSSAIREALKRGAIREANNWLGRRYTLRGVVEHGAARGRDLGFPTANLSLPATACMPSDGIYAALVYVPTSQDQRHRAMVYVGTRPTFDGGTRIVEANILDFRGDLYTQELEVEFVDFIRPDKAFASAEDLSRQMAQDELDTRALLRAYESARNE